MNRKPMFRGKQTENGEWIHGNYVRHETRQPAAIGDRLRQGETKHMIFYDGFADWNMPMELHGIDVDPETIGQSTGLCDMDGNEIYEGDIIRGKGKQTFSIEWSDEIAGYVARASTETTWMPCVNVGTMKLYKVVGNRWDDPELIGSKEGTE